MRGLALAALLGVFSSAAALAQDDPALADGDAALARVPFGVGERLEFRVKFGPLKVGRAYMAVTAVDTVAGHPTYHIESLIEGSVPFYKLRDLQESWLDVYSLVSRRYRQDSRQGDYKRKREYTFDLEARVYRRNDGESDTIPPDPLDDASFVYFVRTVDLEVGATYEWNRYYRLDRNPVIVKVLRREKVKVPAGEFMTLVVQPIIKTRGIFAQGGEARVYLTDDARRMPVKLVTKLKVGSVILELTEYEPGERLTVEALAGG
jgi:hypothetical protein